MNNKQIALSIEQMKHLKELGCNTSTASMHWVYLPTCNAIINNTNELEKEPTLMLNTPGMDVAYPTFSLQDIIELLEKTRYESICFPMMMLDYNSMNGFWYISLRKVDGFEATSYKEKSVLDVAYKMLCWLLEDKYIKFNIKK